MNYAPPDTPVAQRLKAIDEALAEVRPQLSWAADALIPADPDLNMPSASQAHVLDKHLRIALLKRDDMKDAFLAAISRLPAQEPDDAVAAIRALGGAEFDCCARVIAGAYFSDTDVNRALKYPGQQEINSAPDYEAIVDAVQSVMSRDNVYIETPPAAS